MSLSNDIKAKYELGDVLHMTDLQNLESILSRKEILSHNQVTHLGLAIEDISNASVQDGRSTKTIPCSGKLLHDYVPLYWGKKTPMVSTLRDRNETLIFLMFSTNLLSDYSCVISDGNARSAETTFVNFTHIDDLNILYPKDINTSQYANDSDVKRHKQSELLVLNKLPLKHLLRIICFSESVKSAVEKLLTTHGVNCGVYIGKGNYYYL